ncbi:MAG: hypothetical protein EPN48_11245 [Microbacteriaceae bacterium]|nr:MAG: hypothetical protein EPN48_11245 [Microbacteriaceae bacterium]
MTLLIGIVAFAVAWLRLPDIARGTLWAEDGRNFLQDALNSGPIDTLLRPYAGYLQLLPRVIAGLTVQFVPVALYAQAMTAGSCIAAAVMASIVFVSSADVVRWMPARAFIALLTVLAPLVPREVSGNTANLHSLVLWTMFWMLLYRPRTRWGSYLFGLLALMGGLTEIQAVFLFPLFLWRLRDKARLWPRLGCLIGVVVQVCVSLLWPRHADHNPAVGLGSMVYGFLINSVVPAWIPQKAIGPALVWGGPILCIALCAPIIVALVVCLRHGSAVQRVTALGLLWVSIVVYCVSVFENRQSFYQYAAMAPDALNSVWLTRYGVVPSMMLCSLIPLAVAAVRGNTRRAGRSADRRGAVARVAMPCVAIALLASLLVQFGPQDTRRSHGPAWQPQIVKLDVACRYMPDSAVVTVRETIGWYVHLTCGRLE